MPDACFRAKYIFFDIGVDGHPKFRWNVWVAAPMERSMEEYAQECSMPFVLEEDGYRHVYFTPTWPLAGTSLEPDLSPTPEPEQPEPDISQNYPEFKPRRIMTTAATADIPVPSDKLAHTHITRDDQHRLILTIDAKPLHDFLTAIGVKTQSGMFAHRPPSQFATIHRGNSQLSTELFLKLEYPVKVDLSSVFDAPPTRAKLLELAQSTFACVRRIVEWYRPVDISYSVNKLTK